MPADDGYKLAPTSLVVSTAGGVTCLGSLIAGQNVYLTMHAVDGDGSKHALKANHWLLADNAVPVGNFDAAQPTIPIEAPSVGEVRVLAYGYDAVCGYYREVKLYSVSESEAELQTRLCEFVQKVIQEQIPVFHPDPSCDPTRNFSVRPVTRAELARLTRSFEAIHRRQAT